ncbi:TetR family transcriptional regulator, partial [Pantoea agglomerans]|nr:TetR family transcriptional regulator [Pantoea agglomerans]
MAREMIRQGGRSARIQAEVHNTVNRLLETLDRSAITVPMIAEQAGVTPSTIYRRWGDLSQLLADVAVARMRPIAEPEDTGSTAG